MDQGLKLHGEVGAWYDLRKKRSYIFAYATVATSDFEPDAEENFWRYLNAFSDE
jgi:hypothetical protein